MRYLITIPLNKVEGTIQSAALQGVVTANSKEEAIEKAKTADLDPVATGLIIDSYSDPAFDRIIVEEV